MIEATLSILLVVVGSCASAITILYMQECRRWDRYKRELDNESASNGQVLQRKNELIGDLQKRNRELTDLLNKECRYAAAARRALRTRQEVVDSLARELKYIGTLSGHFQDEARTNRDVAESESRMRRVELMLHESQVDQLIKERDRLAAQLKRLKARKA